MKMTKKLAFKKKKKKVCREILIFAICTVDVSRAATSTRSSGSWLLAGRHLTCLALMKSTMEQACGLQSMCVRVCVCDWSGCWMQCYFLFSNIFFSYDTQKTAAICSWSAACSHRHWYSRFLHLHFFVFVSFAVVFPFQAILPGANPCQSSGISGHQTPKAPPISSVRYQLKCQARAGTAAAQLTRADCWKIRKQVCFLRPNLKDFALGLHVQFVPAPQSTCLHVAPQKKKW